MAAGGNPSKQSLVSTEALFAFTLFGQTTHDRQTCLDINDLLHVLYNFFVVTWMDFKFLLRWLLTSGYLHIFIYLSKYGHKYIHGYV